MSEAMQVFPHHSVPWPRSLRSPSVRA